MSYFLIEWQEEQRQDAIPRIKSIKYFCNPIQMFRHILKNCLHNYAIFKAEVVIEVQEGEFIE